MTNFLRNTALVFILSCLWVKLAYSEETAVLACNEFPPYKMENSSSGLPGFDVEFLHEAFNRVGVKPEILYMPWKRALESAKKGKVHGICSCSKTPDRENYLTFSDPLGKASSGLFSLTEQNFPKLKTLEEVGAKSIGTITGYNLNRKLRAAKLQNTIELDSERQGLRMLLIGRIDYYYSYEAPTRYYLAALDMAEQVQYQELAFTNYFTCFSKKAAGTEELLKKFNVGLSEIKADGTYARILEKYR